MTDKQIKYKLWFNTTSFVEYTQKDFDEIPSIDITGLEDDKVVKGKILRVKSPRWKYEAEIIVPVENFEVLNDR